jgi:hypothetical protein
MAVHGHHCVNWVFNEERRVFWEVGQDKQGLSHVVEGSQSRPIQGQTRVVFKLLQWVVLDETKNQPLSFDAFTKRDLDSLNSESFQLLLSIWLHFLNFAHTFGFNLTRCELAIVRSAHEMKREKIGQISYIYKNLTWYNNRWFSCQVYQPKLIHNRRVLSK